MRYDFECKICGKVKEYTFRMTEEKKVECCGAPSLRLYGSQVNPDLLYQFTEYHIGKEPIEIHSKRQWKRELKARGLTDDFDDPKSLQKTERQRAEEFAPIRRKMAEEAYREARKRVVL